MTPSPIASVYIKAPGNTCTFQSLTKWKWSEYLFGFVPLLFFMVVHCIVHRRDKLVEAILLVSRNDWRLKIHFHMNIFYPHYTKKRNKNWIGDFIDRYLFHSTPVWTHLRTSCLDSYWFIEIPASNRPINILFK
jgi:hypothetical protein